MACTNFLYDTSFFKENLKVRFKKWEFYTTDTIQNNVCVIKMPMKSLLFRLWNIQTVERRDSLLRVQFYALHANNIGRCHLWSMESRQHSRLF